MQLNFETLSNNVNVYYYVCIIGFFATPDLDNFAELAEYRNEIKPTTPLPSVRLGEAHLGKIE